MYIFFKLYYFIALNKFQLTQKTFPNSYSASWCPLSLKMCWSYGLSRQVHSLIYFRNIEHLLNTEYAMWWLALRMQSQVRHKSVLNLVGRRIVKSSVEKWPCQRLSDQSAVTHTVKVLQEYNAEECEMGKIKKLLQRTVQLSLTWFELL